jgi:tetratricopeptide (TPR) repeat protein
MQRTRTPGADAQAWIGLGNALMQRSRETPAAASYAQAKAAFREALAIAPVNTQAMLGLAWAHNSAHEFDEGKRWAQRALAFDPQSPDAHALLGDAAVELGDYEAAFEHYQAALDLRPSLASYSRAAHLLWLTGDAQRARWLMQKAIDAGGPYRENTAWCRAELALMLFHAGALVLAEQHASAALTEAPDNPHVLATMGRIEAARGNYAQAIEHYARAADLRPHHDALVGLGDLYALMGRHDEAERIYAQIIALHLSADATDSAGNEKPQGERAGHVQLARFLADHDRDLDRAVAQAEAAYREYPNVFVADTLAWAYYKSGRYAQARTAIAAALRWNTPDAGILFRAGMIHLQLGDSARARNYLYRALNLNPQFHPEQAAIAARTLETLAARPGAAQGASTSN